MADDIVYPDPRVLLDEGRSREEFDQQSRELDRSSIRDLSPGPDVADVYDGKEAIKCSSMQYLSNFAIPIIIEAEVVDDDIGYLDPRVLLVERRHREELDRQSRELDRSPIRDLSPDLDFSDDDVGNYVPRFRRDNGVTLAVESFYSRESSDLEDDVVSWMRCPDRVVGTGVVDYGSVSTAVDDATAIQCKICFDRSIDRVLRCGHVMCGMCLSKEFHGEKEKRGRNHCMKCPFCSAPFQFFLKLYI